MAASSTMLPLGTPIPDFKLQDLVSKQLISPKSFTGKKGILVIFLCRHCPYVKHVLDELVKIGSEYKIRDLGIVSISSNNPVAYPEDSPEGLAQMAKEFEFGFPICFDSTQNVAKAFTAACTPDLFLFDHEGKLVYRGQLDDSRPSNGVPVTGRDLRLAIEAVLGGHPVNAEQKPSMGCSIKWKPGNNPSYQRA
jgi:peroxiredoxin